MTRHELINALDSPTIAAIAQVFSDTQTALSKSYSAQVADILAPRLCNAPAQGATQPDPELTPRHFLDDILSACDSSNWDAERNTGDYYKGLRDAFEQILEIAIEYQTSIYAWCKRKDASSLPEGMRGTDAYRDTVVQIGAAREKRLAQALSDLEAARAYVLSSIASYVGDPPDNDFQRGHLAALEVVRDEAFTPSKLPSTQSSRQES